MTLVTEGYEIIAWDNVKLQVGGKEQTIPFIDLSIDVAEFGRSYTMVPTLFSASRRCIAHHPRRLQRQVPYRHHVRRW